MSSGVFLVVVDVVFDMRLLLLLSSLSSSSSFLFSIATSSSSSMSFSSGCRVISKGDSGFSVVGVDDVDLGFSVVVGMVMGLFMLSGMEVFSSVVLEFSELPALMLWLFSFSSPFFSTVGVVFFNIWM